ncbi:hypothetical protein HYFRA_00000611 [Hymenoscyphus fraxineus]|uniref:NACHT domain-containing protein n=1 Tax=Hymenoscyphus fraxineus TaxID=746836 RepID=A0A9N9L773_9HELO|nr:hypothetical protein HYFRA_00000611 [Hymenoscyphus fraxineus]
MAEVLGIAASVAGLLSLADIVVSRGYKFIKAVKDADTSVKTLVMEVNALSGVLHSLNNTAQLLDEDEESASFDPTTQVHYIEACCQTLLKIQENLLVAMPPSPMKVRHKICWPLKQSQTEELLKEMERHKSTMSMAISATEMSAMIKILARQDSMNEGIRSLREDFKSAQTERRKIIIDEERRRILNFLGSTDARKWQDSNIRLRQPQTGIWFTEGPEFKRWVINDRSQLWIYGIAGAGKTVIVASVIQELEKITNSSNGLAFFYCDYKNSKTHEPLEILGALARQLIAQNEECFEDLKEFYDNHHEKDGSIRSPTVEDLCDLISLVSTRFRMAMIIVDGLDEISNNRAGITRHLKSLNDRSNTIKTLFASRPEIDIGYELEGFSQVSIAANSSDLRLYVTSEIERRTRERRLNIKDLSLKEHIMKVLSEGADGMFRWVSCQMDYLCECSNDRERREALTKLPPDLPSSYERVLERVNRSSKQNQVLVLRTLNWIVYANEPLTTTQLLQALAVNNGEKSFDSSAMTTEEELLNWCSSLVRRNRISSRLELAHFTVKEFLLAINPDETPDLSKYRLSNGHAILAEASIGFLRCELFDTLHISSVDPIIWASTENVTVDSCVPWVEFEKMFPFFLHAAQYWHLYVLGSTSREIEESSLELFISEKPQFRLWTLLSYTRQGHGYASKIGRTEVSPGYVSDKTSPLHWAASLGLSHICQNLILDFADVNQDPGCGTPLFHALLGIPLAVTARGSLVRHCCSPYLQDFDASPKIETAELLLKAGAVKTQLEFEDGPVSVLVVALYLYNPMRGPPSAVKILLDRGYTFSLEDLSYILDVSRDISSLAWTVTKHIGSHLGYYIQPEAHLKYFQLLLHVLASQEPEEMIEEQLTQIVETNFEEIFPGFDGQRLNRTLREGPESKEVKLFRVLCTVIRMLGKNPQTSKETIQKSLTSAVVARNLTGFCTILESNEYLDVAFVLKPREGVTFLHMMWWYYSQGDKLSSAHRSLYQRVFDILIARKPNVTLADNYGISPLDVVIEHVGIETFELFWRCHSIIDYLQSLDRESFMDRVSYLMRFAILAENTEVADFLSWTVFSRKSGFEQQQAIELPSKKVQIWEYISRSDSTTYERPSSQDAIGNTPLHHFSGSHSDTSLLHLKIFLQVYEEGKLFNIKNNGNLTPLAIAVQCKNIFAIQLLLEAGADPNFIVASEQTALHIACQLGDQELSYLLIDYGSDLSQKDSEGLTPAEVALKYGYPDLATSIRQRSLGSYEPRRYRARGLMADYYRKINPGSSVEAHIDESRQVESAPS